MTPPSVSSAPKKMRARNPINVPIKVSETINLVNTAGAIPDKCFSTSLDNMGVSASVMENAMNNRTLSGTRWLEYPGINIRQPPIRQNKTKAVNTASDPIAVMKSCQVI
jgi:hypothetical protein